MRFDLTRYHSLLQAFDLTGRRVFGDDWRGDEAFARPTDDPEPARRTRDALIDRIKALTLEAQPHEAVMALEVENEVYEDASAKLHVIDREIDRLKRELNALPHLGDAWVIDYQAFERRSRIEAELCDAFAKGDLDLLAGPTELVQWRAWSRLPSFKVYFGLSTVRLPSSHGERTRRRPAFVPKVALALWLERFEAVNTATANALTPEARLQVWLRDKIDRYQPKEFSKRRYRDDALAEIPGLSTRAFERVWGQVVPQSWKSSGRGSVR